MADTTQGARPRSSTKAREREARAAEGAEAPAPAAEAAAVEATPQDRQPSAPLAEGDDRAASTDATPEQPAAPPAPDPFTLATAVPDAGNDERKFAVSRLVTDSTLLGAEPFVVRAAFVASERDLADDEELTIAEGRAIVAAFLERPVTTPDKD